MYRAIWWRPLRGVVFAIVALTLIINFINWLRGGGDGLAREGQQCGPDHHWVYQRSTDPEYLCEPD